MMIQWTTSRKSELHKQNYPQRLNMKISKLLEIRYSPIVTERKRVNYNIEIIIYFNVFLLHLFILIRLDMMIYFLFLIFNALV